MGIEPEEIGSALLGALLAVGCAASPPPRLQLSDLECSREPPPALDAPLELEVTLSDAYFVPETGSWQAPVRGVAGQGDPFEVIVLIDVSGSTLYPSGVDLDLDGEVGRVRRRGILPIPLPNTDPGDSIFAAELQAAVGLMRVLDPEISRIGLVSFSGFAERSRGPRRDARVQHRLTKDFGAVRDSLAAIAAEPPAGGTNLEAAIRAGLGVFSAVESATRVLVVVTDGVPSLPHGDPDVADPEDVHAAMQAACAAQSAGVVIHMVAMGELAARTPESIVQIAQLTGGEYRRVEPPVAVMDEVAELRFTRVSSVRVRNLALADTQLLTVGPDGSFAGTVRLAPGPNLVRITAEREDGLQQSVTRRVNLVVPEREL